MDSTHGSLLMRIKSPDDLAAWREFNHIYRPILLRFARSCGTNTHDAEDIAQECLTLVNQNIGRFEYDKQRGGFRRWLRVMVKRRIYNRLRKRREQHAASDVFRRPQLREQQPEDLFERIWLEEHLRHCIKQLRNDVDARTCDAFERLALDSWPVERVCATYDITPNNAYVIKSRLTQRLRAMMADLTGESDPQRGDDRASLSQ